MSVVPRPTTAMPTRIRQLVARSQSPEARCATLAANGQCCLPEVRKLYMKLRSG